MLKTESLFINNSDLLTLGISVIFVGGALLAYNYFFFNKENIIDKVDSSTLTDSRDIVDSSTQTIITSFNPNDIVHNADYFKTAVVSDINIDKANDALRSITGNNELDLTVFTDSGETTPKASLMQITKVNSNEIGIQTDFVDESIESTLSSPALLIPDPSPLMIPYENLIDEELIKTGLSTYTYKDITFVCPNYEDLGICLDFINV